MWKFLVLVATIFILYKLFIGNKKRADESEKKERENLIATGELVKDPVCGTYVLKNADIRVRDGEEVHAFCSYDCRDRYLEEKNVKVNVNKEDKN